MCDDLVTLQHIFPFVRSLSATVEDFPNSSYVGWVALSVLPFAVVVLLSVLQCIGLYQQGGIRYVIDSSSVIYVLVIAVSFMLLFVIVVTVWHEFDLLASGVCYLKLHNASSCQTGHDEYEAGIAKQCATSLLSEAESTLLLLQGVRSFRPLSLTLSIMLGIVPVLPFIVTDKISFALLVALLLLLLGSSVVTFLLQRMCGEYSTLQCKQCYEFDKGMSNVCRVPMFDLTIWIGCVSVLLLIPISRKKRNRAKTKPTGIIELYKSVFE